VKMRGGNHSKDLREYEITDKGIIVGDRLRGYRGLVTGVPKLLNLS
jgi:circadian clock protein KaiC